MVKSMTGFGKSQITFRERQLTIECRTLNSKQLDLNLRLPSTLRALEAQCRSLATRLIVRGKADISISIEGQLSDGSSHINKEAFRNYLRQMTDALSYSGIDASYDALVGSVMRMPDVISCEAQSLTDSEMAAIFGGIESALVQLNEFREREGATLIVDILERIAKIEEYKDELTPFESRRSEIVRNRIMESIAKLNVEADINRLEQEMVYYIEKFDITEEKVRLNNHCQYFREVVREEDGVGRKLGFITQEIGREINTLGSKANDSSIQKLVVKMKDELEKIKEQLLNIL